MTRALPAVERYQGNDTLMTMHRADHAPAANEAPCSARDECGRTGPSSRARADLHDVARPPVAAR